MITRQIIAVGCALGLSITAAFAQVNFDGAPQDTDAPVEVTSDSLRVNQETNTAVFTGNVILIQDDMRMTAQEVTVYYTEDQSDIERVHATGGVTLVTPTEAAEGQEAIYKPIDDNIVMTGSVLLTQDSSTIAGDRLVYDLKEGSGVVSGRVRTLLNQGDN